MISGSTLTIEDGQFSLCAGRGARAFAQFGRKTGEPSVFASNISARSALGFSGIGQLYVSSEMTQVIPKAWHNHPHDGIRLSSGSPTLCCLWRRSCEYRLKRPWILHGVGERGGGLSIIQLGGLKIRRCLAPWRVNSPSRHHTQISNVYTGFEVSWLLAVNGSPSPRRFCNRCVDREVENEGFGRGGNQRLRRPVGSLG